MAQKKLLVEQERQGQSAMPISSPETASGAILYPRNVASKKLNVNRFINTFFIN